MARVVSILDATLIVSDLSAKTLCPVCLLPLHQLPHGLVLLFLCRHVVHADCVSETCKLSQQLDQHPMGMGIGSHTSISGRIALCVACTLITFTCILPC